MGKSLETSRLELHSMLEEFLGSSNVYFQPPESIKMDYPAIIYDVYRVNQRFASDKQYLGYPGWSVTVVDRNKEVDWISDALETFAYCSVERVYVADNLAHYAFISYYS